MIYSRPELDDDESLRLVHDGLVLKWASLTKQIEGSQDKDNVKFFCRQLVRTLELIQSMEEVGF